MSDLLYEPEVSARMEETEVDIDMLYLMNALSCAFKAKKAIEANNLPQVRITITYINKRCPPINMYQDYKGKNNTREKIQQKLLEITGWNFEKNQSRQKKKSVLLYKKGGINFTATFDFCGGNMLSGEIQKNTIRKTPICVHPDDIKTLTATLDSNEKLVLF